MDRLLLIDLGVAWGGQEIYSRSLASILPHRGWKVTCLSPHDRHAIEGVTHENVRENYPHFGSLIHKVNRLVRDHDVVHFNGIRAIYLSLFIAKKTAFVGTKHLPYNTLENPTLKSRMAKLSRFFVFEKLDWLISISDQTRHELPSYVQRRSSVILNGVTDVGLSDIKSIDRSVLTVCFVGRFVKHKGVMRLLEAVNITHCRGVSIKLILAGDGPLMNEARQYVLSHNLSNAVEFLGYVDSPGDVFKISDICCLPSLHEGLPLSLLEAMSAGCALLGHDIPGVRDVIRHGENGILSDLSPDSIASSLIALASGRAHLARLQSKARQDYERNWRLDRMVDETEAVYRHQIYSEITK